MNYSSILIGPIWKLGGVLASVFLPRKDSVEVLIKN